MKIVYVTPDITFNGNFSLYHDLLSNYPTDNPGYFHRLFLVHPTWNRDLIPRLKDRYIDVIACFEDFMPNTDVWWNQIKKHTEDCDVIISGNITNLDEVIPDSVEKPIVSLSLCEQGYKSPSGGYGSFYKSRFHKAAVSKAAIHSFPEHVRKDVKVIYSGIDPSRLSQKVQRQDVRNSWFPGKSDNIRLALFIGIHQDSKGVSRAIQSLDHLPENWHLIVVSPPKDLKVPKHLHSRVRICEPTYDIGDIYLACDCFVLPTEHEGLSMSLLEAWYLGVPVVTTRHKTILELQDLHPDTEFGNLVDINCESRELAEAIKDSHKSESAQECVYKNYMSSNMIDRWKTFLESVVGEAS